MITQDTMERTPVTGLSYVRAATAPTVSTSLVRFWLRVLRQDVKLTRIQLRYLQQQNLRSNRPAVAAGGPVVSVTTHGRRIDTVFLTLESIAGGEMLPSRLLLWLDHPELLARWPDSLRRLEQRGLEIHLSENYGPHTKYYPYLLEQESFDHPLVTADDDVLYSHFWLRDLMLAYEEDPSVINCHRAHVVITAGATVSPYRTWPDCTSTDARFAHFATGVSGCIYPTRFLEFLKSAGSAFLNLCPSADDVWLHANALRAGFRTRQIRNRALNYPFIPATQDEGLCKVNVRLGRNDLQILDTYTPDDLLLIWGEACLERA